METENDYISRTGIIAEYDRQHKGPPGGARVIMATFPAADVRPVVHGKWIKRLEPVGPVKIAVPVCSVCKAIVPVDVSRYKYCPSCGADMREKKHGN